MPEAMLDKIRTYFATQPVEKAWLFGSYARGEQTPESDVDLLVTFSKGTHLGFRFSGIVCDLEDLLEKPVDLVVDGNILPFALESANRDKMLIYERANSR